MHKAESSQATRTQLFLAMGGVFALCCAVYAQVLGFDFVRWDDGMLVYENPAIRAITPSTLAWIFTHFDPELYIPLTFFSYQIDYLLGGIHPFIYHFTNLLLHAGNAALLLLLIERITGRMRVAVLVALLFAIHPLNTEAVAWVSGRKDLLSLFFSLSSLLAFLSAEESGSRKMYGFSVALFLCGLLSKVMVATIPGVLVLILLFQGRSFDGGLIRRLSPYFVLSGVLTIVAFVGKEALVAQTSWALRLFMAAKSTVFYLRQIVWPEHFSVLYPYSGQAQLASPEFLLSVLFLTALVVLGILLWNRARFVAVSVFWYIGTLLPTYFNVGTKSEMDVYFASDRYAYLPSIAVFFFIACILDLLCDAAARRWPVLRTKLFTVVTALIIAILSVLSFRQGQTWSTTETLFQNVIEEYPDASHVAYNNLCNTKRLENDLASAIELCKKAIAIRPHPKTWSNLGAVYRLQNNMTDAQTAYSQALSLDPKSPEAHFGLALVKQKMGDLAGAEAEYRAAISFKSTRDTMEAIELDLGALLFAEGKLDEAVEQYHAALAINPFYPQAHYNLGIVLTKLGRLDEAVAAYKQSIALDPSSVAARINVGIILAKQGDLEGARAQFRAILKIDPANKTAISALQQLK